MSNLEWVTIKENNIHRSNGVIQTTNQNLTIWRINLKSGEKIEKYESIELAAKWIYENKFGNNIHNIRSAISCACRCVYKSSCGFKWELDKGEHLENEIWKEIDIENEDTKGYYISSLGRFKNKKGVIMCNYKPHHGRYIYLRVNKKKYSLHRLVALTFLENVYNKPFVNHIDGNKLNNNVINLEWATCSENNLHSHKMGLTNGHKRKIIQYDLEMNEITKFDTIISPFFGGGSFEFYLQNKYGLKLIVNDKFTPLYNFWKQVKINKNILCEELRKIKSVSKEQFIAYRNTIMDLNDNILQQSIQYFVINRCSFSGSTLSGGFSEEASSKRFTPSSINKIEMLDFTNIAIHNNDFYEFINTFTQLDNSLLFLDPPYYLEKKSKLYGNNGDMHERFNHQVLFDLLNTKKNSIITYNNCEHIRSMYKDFKIIDVNWCFCMNTSKVSSEIIIISN